METFQSFKLKLTQISAYVKKIRNKRFDDFNFGIATLIIFLKKIINLINYFVETCANGKHVGLI